MAQESSSESGVAGKAGSDLTTPDLTAKGANTRARILKIGREVLVTDGYDALVMRTLAQRCGMKLGNLQYYFATRDSLLAAIIETEGLADLDAIRNAVADCSQPTEALSRLVRALVDNWRGGAGVVFSTLSFLALHNATFRSMRGKIYAAFYRELESAIALADPSASKDECRARTRVLTALVDGAAQQVNVGPARRYLDRVAEQAIRIALPVAPEAPEADPR